jgi:hypothetical protein
LNEFDHVIDVPAGPGHNQTSARCSRIGSVLQIR